jgi:hypothetical protein
MNEITPKSLDSKTVIRALRLIFWGGLIVVLDFKFNNFDILHDAVGMLLICLGVFPLAKQPGGPNYEKFMLFVKIVAILSVLGTIFDNFRVSVAWSFVFSTLHLLTLAGIHVFCLAMRNMSGVHNLSRSQNSWKTTLLLFIIIYEIPLGLFYLGILGGVVWVIVTGRTFNFNFNFNIEGPRAIPILVAFFVPLIHLFISTSRMKREIERV